MTSPYELLARAAPLFREYGASVIVAGGIAPVLYRQMPEFHTKVEPLHTREVDLGIPRHLVQHGRPTVGVILTDAGFEVFKVPGLNHRELELTHFQLPTSDGTKAENYIEFISTGDGTVAVQSDLTAQGVKDCELLFHEPMPVVITDLGGEPVTLHVPQPATYIIQKTTAYSKRSHAKKRDKDLAGIFDVALLTRARYSETAASLRRLVLTHEHTAALLRKRMKTLSRLFADADADGPLGVHAQLALGMAAPPTPESIYRAVAAWIAAHMPALD